MKILCVLPLAFAVSVAAICQGQDSGYYGQRPTHLNYRNQLREQANAPAEIGGGSCSATGYNQLKDPRVEVTQQNTDGIAQRTFRLKGYVEGVCLTEAGVYVNGQKQTSIPVDTAPTFKRFAFEFNVTRGSNREIRVYNTQGGQASYSLPDESAENN
jgi:hypothetical protein